MKQLKKTLTPFFFLLFLFAGSVRPSESRLVAQDATPGGRESVADDTLKPSLVWKTDFEKTPKSEYIQNEVEVTFRNERAEKVDLMWIRPRDGEVIQIAGLEAGKERNIKTHEGALWIVLGPAEKKLGYFKVGSSDALAQIQPTAAAPRGVPVHGSRPGRGRPVVRPRAVVTDSPETCFARARSAISEGHLAAYFDEISASAQYKLIYQAYTLAQNQTSSQSNTRLYEINQRFGVRSGRIHPRDENAKKENFRAVKDPRGYLEALDEVIQADYEIHKLHEAVLANITGAKLANVRTHGSRTTADLILGNGMLRKIEFEKSREGHWKLSDLL